MYYKILQYYENISNPNLIWLNNISVGKILSAKAKNILTKQKKNFDLKKKILRRRQKYN